MDSLKTFHCECGKKFKHNYLLENHKASIRGCMNKKNELLKNKKTYKCNTCNKILTTKYNLERHQTKYCNINLVNNANVNEVSVEIENMRNQNSSVSNITKSNPNTNILEEFECILNDGQSADIVKINKMIEKIRSLKNSIANNKIIPNIEIDDQSLFESIREVDSIITNNTTNNDHSITNTNSNNTNSNNISNDNSTNNNTTNNNTTNNITNNNNITVMPIIYPFGYENIKHLSQNDMMKILSSNDMLMKALVSVYSHGDNQNYHKHNDKSDQMLLFEDNYKIKALKDNEFVVEIMDNTIQAIKRMFFICKNKFSIENQLAIWDNIRYVQNTNKNDMKKNYKEMPNNTKALVNRIFNLILQEKKNCNYIIIDKTTKKLNNFDEFKAKLETNMEYKEYVMNLFEIVADELEKYRKSLGDVTITDEILRKYWIAPEDNIELDNEANDVTKVKVEDTPRYKYHKKMTRLENKELAKKEHSIGDINAICNIREERAEKEIETLTDEFDLSDLQARIIRHKLVIDPIGDNMNKIAKLHSQLA